MRDALRRLASLLGVHTVDRERREQDLKDELAFHFNIEVERRMAAGQSPADALVSAKRDFGNVPLVEDVTRGMWGWSMQDYKLGVRMLVKFPGLTVAGGLALAIALGLGAGWYEFSRQLFHPEIPLPDGHRLVEFEAFNTRATQQELRLLHDFVTWRRDLRSVEELSAYRTIERPLTMAGVQTDPLLVAEMTASAFRVARVPALLGRTLIDEDERPGAPAVIVLGHRVWERWFGGRADVIGQHVQLGRAPATVVGVMPEGFGFPVSHQAWLPLPLRAAGYAPLEGGAITVFGRLGAGVTRREAAAELTTLHAREAAASPQTHEYLRMDVNPYGGESADTTLFEYALIHLPILAVLIVACSTVGTLVYARTATREAEITVRSALGASRRRIVLQLFVEALVLVAAAGVVGLTVAHWALEWGIRTLFSSQIGGPPFWLHLGLTPLTVLYAAGLGLAAAAMLGLLPALKATGSGMNAQLRNLGSGGSTLRFGGVWTTVMILEVALTVILLPPAIGITWEAGRDRMIRARFPTGEYLVVPLSLDRASGPADESEAAFVQRLERSYGQLERRVAQEPGVRAVIFADRLPGMSPRVRLAEVEPRPGTPSAPIQNVWTGSVGPGFFEAFERSIVIGRDFHGGDRVEGAGTVIVNEAYARRFTQGASPIGRRVRYWSRDEDAKQPWLEIVGVVRDIGMTPTDFGEAPHIYHAASLGTSTPAVMGVRVTGDSALLVARMRALAAELDLGLRLGRVESLTEAAWRSDIDALLAAAATGGAVLLGLCLSAVAIFSLMSVTVARRTREIGLRTALGASPARVLRGVFSHALLLVGGGVVTGNLLLLLLTMLNSRTVPWTFIGRGLLITSMLMMTVGVLACVSPARRALRIDPTAALRDV
jgi:putative ABC transport system permease protein